jgi:hypothetical protein
MHTERYYAEISDAFATAFFSTGGYVAGNERVTVDNFATFCAF